MRVLVADDHPLFRDGISSLLTAAGFDVIGQAGDGRAAVEEALRLAPDLVLMDIKMPELSGLEALRLIKKELPETPVVMLTISENDEDLFAAIKLGASGYLLKDLDTEEFLNMLAGLDENKAAMTRETTARLMGGFVEASRVCDKPLKCLTKRELDLLQQVAVGLSNRAIAEELSISMNTVKYHMGNILRKLGVQNRTEAVTFAIRAGLLEPDLID